MDRIKIGNLESRITSDDLVDKCLEILGPINVSAATESGLKKYASKFGTMSFGEDSDSDDFEQAAVAVIRLIVCTQEYQTV